MIDEYFIFHRVLRNSQSLDDGTVNGIQRDVDTVGKWASISVPSNTKYILLRIEVEVWVAGDVAKKGFIILQSYRS